MATSSWACPCLWTASPTQAAPAGEAWFSDLLGEAGCQSLGLLGEETPAAAAPTPAPAATPGSGANKIPAGGMWTALALGLAALAASWL